MTKWILICTFFVSTSLFAQELTKVRELYEIAYQNEEVAEQLTNLPDCKGPVCLGYRASAKILLAKHYWNPYSKYSSFVAGRDELEQLISDHPENFELRYLRLIIQSNCPNFLGYNGFINEDKKFVMQHFRSFSLRAENNAFVIKVLSYLETLNAFDTEEMGILHSALE